LSLAGSVAPMGSRRSEIELTNALAEPYGDRPSLPAAQAGYINRRDCRTFHPTRVGRARPVGNYPSDITLTLAVTPTTPVATENN